MRRSLNFVSIACLAIGLNACDTPTTYDAIALTYSAGAAVADLGAKYPFKDYSERAHWIGSPQHMNAVVNLGEVEDPRFHGGLLVGPGDPVSSIPDSYWYNWYNVKYLYAYGPLTVGPGERVDGLPAGIKPYYMSNGIISGPNISGLYIYEVNHNSIGCNPLRVRAHASDLENEYNSSNKPDSNNNSTQYDALNSCFYLRYVSDKHTIYGAYLAYHFIDSVLAKSGMGVWISEIRNPSGELVARGASCFAGGSLPKFAGLKCANDGANQMKNLAQ